MIDEPFGLGSNLGPSESPTKNTLIEGGFVGGLTDSPAHSMDEIFTLGRHDTVTPDEQAPASIYNPPPNMSPEATREIQAASTALQGQTDQGGVLANMAEDMRLGWKVAKATEGFNSTLAKAHDEGDVKGMEEINRLRSEFAKVQNDNPIKTEGWLDNTLTKAAQMGPLITRMFAWQMAGQFGLWGTQTAAEHVQNRALVKAGIDLGKFKLAKEAAIMAGKSFGKREIAALAAGAVTGPGEAVVATVGTLANAGMMIYDVIKLVRNLKGIKAVVRDSAPGIAAIYEGQKGQAVADFLDEGFKPAEIPDASVTAHAFITSVIWGVSDFNPIKPLIPSAAKQALSNIASRGANRYVKLLAKGAGGAAMDFTKLSAQVGAADFAGKSIINEAKRDKLENDIAAGTIHSMSEEAERPEYHVVPYIELLQESLKAMKDNWDMTGALVLPHSLIRVAKGLGMTKKIAGYEAQAKMSEGDMASEFRKTGTQDKYIEMLQKKIEADTELDARRKAEEAAKFVPEDVPSEEVVTENPKIKSLRELYTGAESSSPASDGGPSELEVLAGEIAAADGKTVQEMFGETIKHKDVAVALGLEPGVNTKKALAEISKRVQNRIDELIAADKEPNQTPDDISRGKKQKLESVYASIKEMYGARSTQAIDARRIAKEKLDTLFPTEEAKPGEKPVPNAEAAPKGETAAKTVATPTTEAATATTAPEPKPAEKKTIPVKDVPSEITPESIDEASLPNTKGNLGKRYSISRKINAILRANGSPDELKVTSVAPDIWQENAHKILNDLTNGEWDMTKAPPKEGEPADVTAARDRIVQLKKEKEDAIAAHEAEVRSQKMVKLEQARLELDKARAGSDKYAAKAWKTKIAKLEKELGMASPDAGRKAKQVSSSTGRGPETAPTVDDEGVSATTTGEGASGKNSTSDAVSSKVDTQLGLLRDAVTEARRKLTAAKPFHKAHGEAIKEYNKAVADLKEFEAKSGAPKQPIPEVPQPRGLEAEVEVAGEKFISDAKGVWRGKTSGQEIVSNEVLKVLDTARREQRGGKAESPVAEKPTKDMRVEPEYTGSNVESSAEVVKAKLDRETRALQDSRDNGDPTDIVRAHRDAVDRLTNKLEEMRAEKPTETVPEESMPKVPSDEPSSLALDGNSSSAPHGHVTLEDGRVVPFGKMVRSFGNAAANLNLIRDDVSAKNYFRVLSETLLKHFGDRIGEIQVFEGNLGADGPLGRWSAFRKYIIINRAHPSARGREREIVLHEVMHGLTNDVIDIMESGDSEAISRLTSKQIDGYRELKEIFEEYKKRLTWMRDEKLMSKEDYDTHMARRSGANMNEFAAWAMVNHDTQNRLSQMKTKSGLVTMWNKVIRAVRKMLRLESGDNTQLDRAINAILNIASNRKEDLFPERYTAKREMSDSGTLVGQLHMDLAPEQAKELTPIELRRAYLHNLRKGSSFNSWYERNKANLRARGITSKNLDAFKEFRKTRVVKENPDATKVAADVEKIPLPKYHTKVLSVPARFVASLNDLRHKVERKMMTIETLANSISRHLYDITHDRLLEAQNKFRDVENKVREYMSKGSTYDKEVAAFSPEHIGSALNIPGVGVVEMTNGERFMLMRQLMNDNLRQSAIISGIKIPKKGGMGVMQDIRLVDTVGMNKEQAAAARAAADKRIKAWVEDHMRKYPEMKSLNDHMDHIFNNMIFPEFKRVYMELHPDAKEGDLEQIEHYMKLRRDVPLDIRDNGKSFFVALEEQLSSSKKRKKSNNPIIIGDAFGSLARSVSESAKYIGYATRLKELRELIGDRGDGTVEGRLQSKIDERLGSGTAQEYLDRLFDIEGVVNKNELVMVRKIMQMQDVARLSGVSTMLKQIPAVILPALNHDLSLVIGGIFSGRGAEFRNKVLDSRWGAALKARLSTHEFVEERGEDRLWQNRTLRRIGDASMLGTRIMDEWSVKKYIDIAANVVDKEGKFKAGTEEYYADVARKASEMVNSYQPSGYREYRTALHNTGTVGVILNRYRTSVNAIANAIWRNHQNVIRNPTDRAAAAKFYASTGVVMGAQALMFSMIDNKMQAQKNWGATVGDDELKKKIEKDDLKHGLAGNMLEGVANNLAQALPGENLVDPLIKEYVSLVRGADPADIRKYNDWAIAGAFPPLDVTYSAARRMMALQSSARTIYEKETKTSEDIQRLRIINKRMQDIAIDVTSEFFGLPMKHFNRYLGITGHIEKYTR